MVGHKVDDDLQSCLVRALYQGFKLLHALIYVDGKIGIDIIIVADGVRRACPTLHHGWVLGGYAILRVVGLGSMTYHTRKPYV